jgi:hypothetical protein
MAGPKKKQTNVPPQGTIRRSQMVTTYGPGSMIDLVDQAALVGGLDFWSYNRKKGDPVLVEPRLRESLAERFKIAGRELSVDKAFREPPIGDDREPVRYSGVQVLEFPQWFVCQSPRCRALMFKSGLELKKERYWHPCGTGGRLSEAVPVRFLGACRRGHCEDWPWIAFAHLHREGGRCGAPSLSFTEGATGDFSEATIECACGARELLASAMFKGPDGKGLFGCTGRRPWLGAEGGEDCTESLRLLVRTASNSYFSQVVSALSVPEPGKELDDAIEVHWGTLQVANENTLAAFRTVPGIDTALRGWSDPEVLGAVKAKRDGTSTARDPLRTAEFKQLVTSPDEQPGDRPPAESIFFARRVVPTGGLPQGVAQLVLAPKLREVRAQIGFTRLEPATPDLQGEFDLRVESAPLGLTTNWLPATEILGEGVFLQLDEDAVRDWAEREPVKARTDELRRGYEQWKATLSPGAQDKAPDFLGARYYLLHSLSHLLISAISLECGYSASAIRERIYCGPSARDPSTPMAAVLLSTGSSGSEGTLGGLVEQGRKIGGHLRRAWDLGRLCANDPVCAAHSPDDDPAERYLEGAGCHGCLFIAETSCERFNRFLDRALVVPTVGRDKELAFFRERP